MDKEDETKEEQAAEDLKEDKAQEETRSALVHVPLEKKEPKLQHFLDEQKETGDEQIAQFLAILKKLQVNISFAEKFLTSIFPSIILTKECSALVQKKLPPKYRISGSFLIPCTIGTIAFEKALCDLGSSINLIHLSVMKKLGIQEVHPTRISLEIADKSLKRAYGMVENVLVKVENLYLSANFVILDTREDKNDSIILGRPFLATGKALIDVEK
ncbi:uncharacterized protein LOC130963236 [Arachis stenosperma]|uniref:uncharacterized protein LOC130963236 n=1 Tax=Arachis stenosperma TaxID=217475 RepID=UPI0025AD1D7E|nr:uncharacterized protein LOC130963236 [Arachis stenosperma]